jgi:hypothetical protein
MPCFAHSPCIGRERGHVRHSRSGWLYGVRLWVKGAKARLCLTRWLNWWGMGRAAARDLPQILIDYRRPVFYRLTVMLACRSVGRII